MGKIDIDRKNNLFDYKMMSEFDAITSKKCKCGHKITFHSKNPYNVCRYCGNINFLNNKAEFDYRIKRRLGV